MKIFATFIIDGDGHSSISRIGLNPSVFSKEKFKALYSEESYIYFQNIDPDTEVTDYNNESWKPYNGDIASDCGWMIDNKFVSEKDFNIPYDNYEFPKYVKHEVYQDGELSEIKIIKEDW